MNKENGFTLVELMITLLVVTVLLALGVPSFTEFIKNNRLAAQTNDFVIAMQLARNEAVKRGTGTVVCASEDQSTCSGSNDWSTGWIIFSDLDQEGDLEEGTGACLLTEDCILRKRGPIEKNNTLTGSVNQAQYLPNGLLRGSNMLTFTLVSRDCKTDQARIVNVTRHGHTSTTKSLCP